MSERRDLSKELAVVAEMYVKTIEAQARIGEMKANLAEALERVGEIKANLAETLEIVAYYHGRSPEDEWSSEAVE